MTNVPIFLAGIDRTGIGLLAELIDAHPDVAITRRINFWDFYAGRYGSLDSTDHLERCVNDMMRYTRVRRLRPDVERIISDFSSGERTYARLFQLLQEQNCERLGKARWGDKSLGAERHAEKILTAFPSAVMIHVIRDPRDRYASRATHRQPGRGGVGGGTAAWLWSARRAQEVSLRHAGRYRVVRYEDLVRQPHQVMTSLCEWAGLEYASQMLQMEDGSPRAIHTDSIGRFRTDLSTGEIRFIERVAGREMRSWGYEPSSPPWALGERRRFALTTMPVAAVGLVLWRPWAGIQRKFMSRPSVRRTLTDS